MTSFDSSTVFTLTGVSGGSHFLGSASAVTNNGTASLRSGTTYPYTFKTLNDQGADMGTGHDFIIDYNATDGWHIRDGGGSNPNFYYKGSYTTPATQTKVSILQGDVIYFGNSSGEYYHTTITGLSSGGGTFGGTVYVQDAKIVNYGGITGLRFEQRGYPAASYELIGPGSNTTWTLTSQSNNLQHHISNLSSGTYYLWQDSVLVATLIASVRKKVHCNFW